MFANLSIGFLVVVTIILIVVVGLLSSDNKNMKIDCDQSQKLSVEEVNKINSDLKKIASENVILAEQILKLKKDIKATEDSSAESITKKDECAQQLKTISAKYEYLDAAVTKVVDFIKERSKLNDVYVRSQIDLDYMRASSKNRLNRNDENNIDFLYYDVLRLFDRVVRCRTFSTAPADFHLIPEIPKQEQEILRLTALVTEAETNVANCTAVVKATKDKYYKSAEYAQKCKAICQNAFSARKIQEQLSYGFTTYNINNL